MPAFIFVGGPECGDITTINMYGVMFPLGVPTPVNDLFIERKLRGNRFFEEVPGDDDGSADGGEGTPEDWLDAGGTGGSPVVGIDGDASGDSGAGTPEPGDKPRRGSRRVSE